MSVKYCLYDLDGTLTDPSIGITGVLWGYGSKEELQNAGAEYILSEPSDILQLF